MSEIEKLEQAVVALEAQRTILGDAIVDTALAPLREKLTKLQSQTLPSEQQRKAITVLFADVSGFTALSETMDAEDVSATMNALWEGLDTAITTHGGKIDKHIGDAVMALWGAETARENDPEQAIRAALAMQMALQEFRSRDLAVDDWPRGLPSPTANLQIRIGLNTGPALLGEVGTTGEFTAMGDTVNLASRLEHAAPVGGILISHNTYQHVRDIFEVEPQPPLMVKGKVEPIRTYVVRLVKTRTFRNLTRGVEGVETRTIGRAAELLTLQNTFQAAMEDAEMHIVTILGEAGVGKSRLLYDFENWLELLPERVQYFKGRATQGMAALPYALWRDTFTTKFEILDSDSSAVAREKMERGIEAALGTDERGRVRAHFIGHLFGFDFSASPHLQGALDNHQQLYERAATYLGEYVSAMATHPMVIFLEDIHWADDRSLDLLSHLARTVPQLKLIIVCLSRRRLLERRPAWGEGQDFHLRVELQALSRRDTRRLVDEILRRMDEVPADLRELIVTSAEGNPFYVEELIKMLIDDRVILTHEIPWRVEQALLPTVRVPPTLIGVLQARLDGLSAAERLTLQRASVVGRLFWDSALRMPNVGTGELRLEDGNLNEILGKLRSRELIFQREESSFAGTREFIFKQSILRDVAYESVLKRVRRVYHAWVAAWLVDHSGERVGEYLGVVADHYERAGEFPQALAYLRRAGEQALRVGALREGAGFFERALTLAASPEAQPEQAALTLQLGETYMRLGELGPAKAMLEKSLALARESGNRQAMADRLGHLGRAIWGLGHYDEARRYLNEALGLARQLGDALGIARAEGNLGTLALSLGAYAEAKERYEASLALARTVGDQVGVASALNNLGNVANAQGVYIGAIEYYRAGIATFKKIDRKWETAVCLGNLGVVVAALGANRRAEAEAYYQESLTLCRELGDQFGAANTLGNLGLVACEAGDYARARGYLSQALKMELRLGAVANALFDLVTLAKLLSETGEPERAAELLGLVLNHPMTSNEAKERAEPLMGKLRLTLSPGDMETALERGRTQPLGEAAAILYAVV